jgi:hypothetical protein
VVFSGKTLINSVLIAGAELAIPAVFEPLNSFNGLAV